MIDSVLNEVVSALKYQGVQTSKSFSERNSNARHSPCAIVSCNKAVCESSGFGQYLGIRKGSGGESDVELYGKKVDCDVMISVYSPFGEKYGAEFCTHYAENVRCAINALPNGIRISKFEFSDVFVDPEVSAYCMKCVLHCNCYFVAERYDDTEFLDYVLKGTVVNEHK